MSELVFDTLPHNFRSSLGKDVVTGDVYRIADRMAEIDPRLMLRDRVGDGWPEDGGFRYTVSEMCDDGVERWVMGIRNGELDQRQIEKLQIMLTVPFEKRFDAAEAEAARRDAQHENAELDRMVEEIGLPMLRDLERCGFIQRRASYSKRGTLGPRVGVGRAA